MRQPLVVGNWKMNGSLGSVRALLDDVRTGAPPLEGVELAVLPPFVYLSETASRLTGSPVGWGAQNLSEYASGAYTGEIAGAMLADYDCRYVLVGHSERRSLYGETSERVADKFVAARAAGLVPILCIGETLAERETDRTESVIAEQLDVVLARVGADDLAQAVIAYEPVWAIGTGRTATPEQAQAVHAFIRGRLAAHDGTIADSMRILYGGSVKAANAGQLLRQPDIDGGLIGGASLNAKEFLTIAQAGKADD